MQIRDAHKYSGQDVALNLVSGVQIYGTLRYAGGDQIAIEQWFNKGTVQICLHQIKWWYRIKSRNQNCTQHSTGGGQMIESNPVMTSVREVLDKEGIEYSIQMGRRVILREGLADYTMVDFGYGTPDSIVLQKILSNRRTELAHVASVLQEKGATLTRKEEIHGPTVDEVYHFVIEGQEIYLVLRVD